MKSASLKVARPEITAFEAERKFQESALKLHWARLHAHHLSTFWEEVVQSHYAAAVGGDVKLGYSLDDYLLQPPIPFQIPLLMGDCIRNLRSALDYLLSDMARAANLSDEITVFPFARDPASLKASFNESTTGDKHRKGRRAGALYDLSRKYPNLEKVILTDIQPHESTNGANPFGDLLWRIITSDNVDKHRLMTPAVQQIDVRDIRFTSGNQLVGPGTNIGNIWKFPPGTKLHQDSDFSIDIIFEDPARLAGKPVLSTLIQGCEQVGSVIEIFRREIQAPA